MESRAYNIVRSEKGDDEMSMSLHHMSRSEAYEVLVKMKVADLKDLAKSYNVYIRQGNKRDIVEKIINGTVGVRLKSEAIKTLTLK